MPTSLAQGCRSLVQCLCKSPAEARNNNFGLIASSGGSVTGTSVTSVIDTSAVTSTSDTSVTGLANAKAQMIGAGVSGLGNTGAEIIPSTGVVGLANIGANVVCTGLSAIGSMLSSSSESPAEAGTNSSPGGYELNLDTDYKNNPGYFSYPLGNGGLNR